MGTGHLVRPARDPGCQTHSQVGEGAAAGVEGAVHVGAAVGVGDGAAAERAVSPVVRVSTRVVVVHSEGSDLNYISSLYSQSTVYTPCPSSTVGINVLVSSLTCSPRVSSAAARLTRIAAATKNCFIPSAEAEQNQRAGN